LCSDSWWLGAIFTESLSVLNAKKRKCLDELETSQGYVNKSGLAFSYYNRVSNLVTLMQRGVCPLCCLQMTGCIVVFISSHFKYFLQDYNIFLAVGVVVDFE
jgi:hypothetical protein